MAPRKNNDRVSQGATSIISGICCHLRCMSAALNAHMDSSCFPHTTPVPAADSYCGPSYAWHALNETAREKKESRIPDSTFPSNQGRQFRAPRGEQRHIIDGIYHETTTQRCNTSTPAMYAFFCMALDLESFKNRVLLLPVLLSTRCRRGRNLSSVTAPKRTRYDSSPNTRELKASLSTQGAELRSLKLGPESRFERRSRLMAQGCRENYVLLDPRRRRL